MIGYIHTYKHTHTRRYTHPYAHTNIDGQTGSGKTHTMMGHRGDHGLHVGIIPRLMKSIFHDINANADDIHFTVKLSYVEIYNERIRDLLDVEKQNLKIREAKMGVWIEDVTEVYVASYKEVQEVMSSGASNRTTAETQVCVHAYIRACVCVYVYVCMYILLYT